MHTAVCLCVTCPCQEDRKVCQVLIGLQPQNQPCFIRSNDSLRCGFWIWVHFVTPTSCVSLSLYSETHLEPCLMDWCSAICPAVCHARRLGQPVCSAWSCTSICGFTEAVQYGHKGLSLSRVSETTQDPWINAFVERSSICSRYFDAEAVTGCSRVECRGLHSEVVLKRDAAAVRVQTEFNGGNNVNVTPGDENRV